MGFKSWCVIRKGKREGWCRKLKGFGGYNERREDSKGGLLGLRFSDFGSRGVFCDGEKSCES